MSLDKSKVRDEVGCVVLDQRFCDFARLERESPEVVESVREDNVRSALVYAIMTGRSQTLLPGVRLRGLSLGRHDSTEESECVTSSPIQDIYYDEDGFFFRTSTGSLYHCASDAFLDELLQAVVRGMIQTGRYFPHRYAGIDSDFC